MKEIYLSNQKRNWYFIFTFISKVRQKCFRSGERLAFYCNTPNHNAKKRVEQYKRKFQIKKENKKKRRKRYVEIELETNIEKGEG